MNDAGKHSELPASADALAPPPAGWQGPRRWMTEVGRFAFRRRPLNRYRYWVRKTFRHWCVDEELVVPTTVGFQFAASPRDYTSYGIYFFGEYDASMTTALRHLVREGQTVWDVGTERGWFSCLLAHLVGPTGRVDSFEAFPMNAARLRRNLALNEMAWVRANQVAVSDTIGEAVFQMPSHAVTTKYSCPDNCSGVGFLTQEESAETIRVPTITLDRYAKDTGLRSLSLIKIDIEGAEVQALRGAQAVIAEQRPILAIEYNRVALARAGSSWDELDALLEQYGYDRFTYRGEFRRLRNSDFEKVADHFAVTNIYAFPRESNITEMANRATAGEENSA